MNEIARTNSQNNDFIDLVKLLDADLAIRDGDDHDFYNQFNSIDHIKNAVVLSNNGKPVSCGAIKEYDASTMEVKRMYTLPEQRGSGLASIVLNELENWARELGYSRCILETGIMQPEAIRLYQKNGYVLIKNYGQYVGIINSKCFEKRL